MKHDLKTWPEYYRLVENGIKRAEIRKDDRGIGKGDVVTLREFEPLRQEYTGASLSCMVTMALRGGCIPDGYVFLCLGEPGEC